MPRFFWVDNVVLTHYARLIKPAGVAIYSALCMHADRQQEAHISLDTICAETGIETREAVLKYLNLLEQHGLIAIVRRPDRRGNVYRLLDVVGEPGTPRPNKPSARVIGAPPAPTPQPVNGTKPVNQAVGKSVDNTTPAAPDTPGTVGFADTSAQELSATPTSTVGISNSSGERTVGKTDSNSPELSVLPTHTRLKTRQSRLPDVSDDDDTHPRARGQGRSSSSPGISRLNLETQYGERAVKMALEVAEGAGKPGSIRYAAGILRNWQREGTMPRKARGINPYDWEPVTRDAGTDPSEWETIGEEGIDS